MHTIGGQASVTDEAIASLTTYLDVLLLGLVGAQARAGLPCVPPAAAGKHANPSRLPKSDVLGLANEVHHPGTGSVDLSNGGCVPESVTSVSEHLKRRSCQNRLGEARLRRHRDARKLVGAGLTGLVEPVELELLVLGRLDRAVLGQTLDDADGFVKLVGHGVELRPEEEARQGRQLRSDCQRLRGPLGADAQREVCAHASDMLDWLEV